MGVSYELTLDNVSGPRFVAVLTAQDGHQDIGGPEVVLVEPHGLFRCPTDNTTSALGLLTRTTRMSCVSHSSEAASERLDERLRSIDSVESIRFHGQIDL